MLYLVPTPIGNLEDITLRAINILKQVDYILAEDTRTSGVLLKHYQIETPMKAYHQHNEHKVVQHIVNDLLSGKTIACVTDAGTPGLSDPAFLLVREAVKNNIKISCLPGATALIPALINSALPMHNFCFEGFLPIKKGRQTILKKLANEERTIALYESPHKLLKTLTELSAALGENREACVCREISKLYEENHRGSLKQLVEYFSTNTPKGEIVIVISGKNNE